MNAFDWADYYRIPVMILGDGILAQMAEPVEIVPYKPILDIPEKDYILTGCKGRASRVVKTLVLDPPDGLVAHNEHLQQKYQQIQKELPLCEEYETADAELVLTGYGICGRIAKAAVRDARSRGMRVGFIRPITLWPFPAAVFRKAAQTAKKMLVVEMSHGQMIEDVKLSIDCSIPVEFFGKGGGWYPDEETILEKIESLLCSCLSSGRAG